jgi:hypothetical protein
MATGGEIRWPPAGRNDGHQWGIKWPPVGRNRWPLTVSRKAQAGPRRLSHPAVDQRDLKRTVDRRCSRQTAATTKLEASRRRRRRLEYRSTGAGSLRCRAACGVRWWIPCATRPSLHDRQVSSCIVEIAPMATQSEVVGRLSRLRRTLGVGARCRLTARRPAGGSCA